MIIREALTDEMFPTFLAEEGGETIGIAICGLRRYPGLPRPTTCLYELKVEAHHQGKGIGRELLTRVIQFAASHNSVILELVMKQGNKSASALYEKFKIAPRPDVIVHTLALDQATPIDTRNNLS